MGFSKYAYVGPYIKIALHTQEVVESFFVDSKGQKVSNRFNPNTGEEYIEKEITKIKRISITNLDEYFGEEFWFYTEFSGTEDSIFILMSNIFEKEEAGVYDLPAFDLETFKNQHKESFDKLSEDYNYELKFGLVIYTA